VVGEEADVVRLVDDLYAAALDPSTWSEVLTDVMRLFRGSGATLEAHHKTTKELLFFEGLNVSDAQQEAYTEHFIHVCPRLPAAVSASEGDVLYDGLFISERGMDRSEFYQDFLAPCDMRYLAGLALINTGDRLGVFGVHRSAREGHISPEEIGRLQVLMPHMRRALQLSTRLTGLELERGNMRDALSRLTTAVLLLDDRCRVRFMNDAAREALPDTPLRLVEGRLRGRSSAHTRRIRRAVGDVLAARAGERGVPYALVLEDVDRNHVLQLCPLPSLHHRWDLFARDAAESLRAILVFDPPSSPTSIDLLQARFAMTRAEAECAMALAEGCSPREIATSRGVQLSTVRTLVARARDKAGARSQADLVRRVVAACRTHLRSRPKQR